MDGPASSVLLVTAAVPVVWGSTYAVTTEVLPPDRPLLAAALRALPAGLLLLAVTRRLPTGSWWWRSAVLGSLNIGAFFALLFVSAYRLPGGVAAVLGAAGPLLVAGLSVVLLHERLTTRRLLAGMTAAAGVALTVLTPQAGLDRWGVLAGLAGAASMALGLVLTKRWGRPAPVLTVTGWQLTAGGLVLLPLALAVEGPPPTLTTVHLTGYAYLSLVGSAAAYTLWFRGLERLPAASVSLLGQLSPVVAAGLGWIALGQRLTVVQVLGMVVALGGVALGQDPGRRVSAGAASRAAAGPAESPTADSAATASRPRPQEQNCGRFVALPPSDSCLAAAAGEQSRGRLLSRWRS
jgi:probable blue pigment (indigoidine) exporter